MIQEEQQVEQMGQLKKRTRKNKRIAKQKSKNKQKRRKRQPKRNKQRPQLPKGPNFQIKKYQLISQDASKFLTEEQQKGLKDFFMKIDQFYNQRISQSLKNDLQTIIGIGQNFSDSNKKMSDRLIPHNKILGYCNLIGKWKQYTSESHLKKVRSSSIAFLKNPNSRTVFLIESHQMNPQEREQLNFLQISEIQAEILYKRSMHKRVCTNSKQLAYKDDNALTKVKLQKMEDQVGQLDQQIQFLSELYAKEEIQLTKQYKRILKSGNYEPNIQKNKSNQPSEETIAISQSDIFMENLVYKTFKGAFDDQKIDRFNYHRALEFQQLKKQIQKYQPILNKDKFVEFLQKRKGKKGKALKFQLFTNCLACFSPLSEQSNSFTACKECHFRTHKICSSFQQKCDRCNYKKLNQQKKQEIPECLICGIQDLMFQKISSTKYIHQFCMLIHNMWKIDCNGSSDRKVIRFEWQTNELRQKLDKSQIGQCSFCPENSPLKKSPVCFLKQCQDCGNSFHAMCGYLRGGCKFNFEMMQKARRANFKISCCSESKEERARIASDRRFKVNFQKVVFRSNGIGKQKKLDGVIEQNEIYDD